MPPEADELAARPRDHFLVPPADGVDEAEEGTRLRYARLQELAAAGTAPEEALASHLPEEQPVCRHRGDNMAWANSSAQPPLPSLGTMVGTGRDFLEVQPTLLIYPSMLIVARRAGTQRVRRRAARPTRSAQARSPPMTHPIRTHVHNRHEKDDT